jgi:hypothetical protein
MKNKFAVAVAAGAFTTALIGGVALAAFQPFAPADGSVIDGPAATVADKDAPKDKVKAILDGLVSKGTITQAQEDAILQAFKDAAPARPSFPPKPGRPSGPSVMSFIGDLTKAAADYLGVDTKTLVMQLRGGKSVADIANGIPGKSAQGAIDAITKAADDRLDAAVAAKKLTADQAAALKPKIATQVAAFVSRSFTKPVAPFPRPNTPVKPTPSPKS